MSTNLSELERFLYEEAALLDDGKYDQWLDLFADHGRYWVPLQGAAQSESSKCNSIADEDKLMLALRIERLRAGFAHSQQPGSTMQHLLQRPTLLAADGDGAVVATLRTPFMYAESRGDSLVQLHGHYIHKLISKEGKIQMALKRVNLVNASSRLPMIQLFP